MANAKQGFLISGSSPYTYNELTGVASVALGLNNSNSNKFTINVSSSPGATPTGTQFVVESDGTVQIGDLTAGAVVANSTGILASANGTVGYILTSNGTSLPPTFQPNGGGGSGTTSFATDSGSAAPSAGVITMHGGTGITTSGSGSTVTFSASGALPTSFPTNSGTATPSGGNLSILGTGGITTTGSGSTVTISGSGLGGGAVVLLQTVTASNSANLVLNAFSNTYQSYLIIMRGLVAATLNSNIYAQYSNNGGASFISGSSYESNVFQYAFGGSTGFAAYYFQDRIVIARGLNPFSGINGQLYLNLPPNNLLPTLNGNAVMYNGIFNIYGSYGAGLAVNAMQFYMDLGNITSGTISLYGITQ